MGESGVGAKKWKCSPGNFPEEARLNRTWDGEGGVTHKVESRA